MLYASEVIGLLGAFPGREFKMAAIRRHVCGNREQSPKQIRAMQRAIQRVLAALKEQGMIDVDCPEMERGASCLYRWKKSAT